MQPSAYYLASSSAQREDLFQYIQQNDWWIHTTHLPGTFITTSSQSKDSLTERINTWRNKIESYSTPHPTYYNTSTGLKRTLKESERTPKVSFATVGTKHESSTRFSAPNQYTPVVSAHLPKKSKTWASPSTYLNLRISWSGSKTR